MPYVVVGVPPGKTFSQRERLTEVFQDHQKPMAESAAAAFRQYKGYRWVKVEEVVVETQNK